MNIAPLEPLAPEDFAAALNRLVLTRWIACGLVVVLAPLCARVFAIPLPVVWLLWLGGALAGYNAVLTLLAALVNRATAMEKNARVGWFRRLLVVQVALDWVAMSAFVHFTGGITSPAIPLFLIHMLIMTVLVPSPSPYTYVALATTALIAVAGLEGVGTLAHYRVLPLPEELHRDGRFVSAQIAFFAITAFASVHLTRLVVARLRERDRQVAALLRATQATASSLDLDEVLDQLVQTAAHALSAKGAALRLLDETGERMEVTASIGLSERYLNRGFVGMSRSQTDREALAGASVIVADALRDPRIQRPEEIAAEGIGSIVIVPVVGRRGPLGVLRVYGEKPDAFVPEDVAFARSIASQGAAAIENALAHKSLQRAESSRGQFVRMVTHELRSPLAGSLSLLNVIRDGLLGELSPEQRAMLARVSARLISLTELVNDLLDLAATKSADLQDKPIQVDLLSALRRAVEQQGSEATVKGVEVSLEAPPAPLVVRATDRGLASLFGNLIGNGVKYTPRGGQVRVRVSLVASSVEVAVEDTGMGIPEADLPELFQEFFRAHNARSSEISGTGLGLAIVKRLVTSYGGTVGVRSEIGQGTTFTVVLPLCKVSGRASADL